jgi:hypothetical protein
MNLNYPHREPLVVRNHELRIIRRFKGGTDVKVRSGERIEPEQVIARVDPNALAIRIPIAEQLGVAPQDVAKHLMRPVGSSFTAGEALARTRRGLRNVVVAAPVSGVLLSVDAATGVAALVPGSAGEIRSLIPGDVEFIDGREAVSIRTVGTRLLGIFGFGEPAAGALSMVVSRPDEEVQAARITPALTSKIVVGGSWASAAALKRLIEVGAAGLVCGGLVEKEIVAGLGLATEDRLAPWRLTPADRAVGAAIPAPITLMATEGFGALPMHPQVFALLQEHDGQDAVLFAVTRVTGQLSRPELIVPNAAALDEDGDTSLAVFVEGAHVRLTDQANLGRPGTIAGPPRQTYRGDGMVIDVVDVELAGGMVQTVPIANVEIVA